VADAAGRSIVILDGQADVERNVSLRADHLFQIGSISKSFTAIAILRFAERGAIDLEAPVRRYLPWFRAGTGHAITIHQLLSHSSGLPMGADFSDSSTFDAWIVRELDTEPPGRYWYSNLGYKILGLALEAVAGRSYGAVLRDEILDPLAMSATHPVITFADRHLLATGYEPQPGTFPVRSAPVVPAPYIEVDTGDGSVAATPAEMGQYLAALLADGQGGSGLLTSSSLDRFLGRHVHVAGERWYGYGMGVDALDGRPVFSHGGDMLGFRASLVGSRVAGLGVAVLTNTRVAPTPLLARHALRVAIAEAAAEPWDQLDPGIARDAAEWLGSYSGMAGRLTITVRAERSWAAFHDGTYELLPGDAGRFDMADAALGRYPLSFRRTRRGRVAVHGGNIYTEAPDEFDAVTSTRRMPRLRRVTGRYDSHNPWRRSFDVVSRGRDLVIIEADGEEDPLRSIGGDRFRVGAEPNPERLAFDAVVDGRAMRALATGHPYYRTGE
jgi:CubicO group peptidase (beta-lactamase class C family)